MFSDFWNACKNLFNRVKETIKSWTKPTTTTIAVDAIKDMVRSKSDLVVENALLRQQLIVLKRTVKRPKFANGDRTRMTLLARFTNFWQSALLCWQLYIIRSKNKNDFHMFNLEIIVDELTHPDSC